MVIAFAILLQNEKVTLPMAFFFKINVLVKTPLKTVET